MPQPRKPPRITVAEWDRLQAADEAYQRRKRRALIIERHRLILRAEQLARTVEGE